MTLSKVNVAAAFATVGEYGAPKIGGYINEARIKFAKFSGAFHGHHQHI